MSTEVRCDRAVTDDLRVLVTAMLRAEYGPSAVQTLNRAASVMASSYPAEVVTVGLADGRVVKIFLKDLSSRRYDRDLAERRSLEIAVYRDLLADANLGTPRYYGSVSDPGRNRFWLLLEHVEGTCLRDEPFSVWVQAAAWLGRMQAHVAAHPELLHRCRLLKPLTHGLFLSTAATAERAAAAYAPELAGRVVRALEGYPELAGRIASQPPTLVHGSYRPQNILLRAGAGPGAQPPMCPVDWEGAALGPAGYDLAYLSDGFDEQRRQLLVAAYRMAAAEHGLRVHEGEEADVLLDGCDLHKNLKTLGKAADRGFPVDGVHKLVRMVEVAAARALRRRNGAARRAP
ncbi:phosphotransferase family enzyme [Micromonospora kangleipakensis]|uniref:Phosphotransferase family enzyme n=1 Tax=Micromonospora kangleipakensis TaxID=1077942 RepID=A0A4Q8BEL8_9ACTN|nr:aminoglycoside phosphotransferase family protein [Micromonospora kangleipakensis]RZU75785.1 phosphotransferase family enzyme [Micromonospora kangleipakensis]